MEKLKQVEMKNGKFTLEGKVVEVDVKKLYSLPIKSRTPEVQLKMIYEDKPRGADAYVIGKVPKEDYVVSWVGHDIKGRMVDCTDYYPILYLKIKGENENGEKKS